MARHRKPGRPKGSVNKKVKTEESNFNRTILTEIVALLLFAFAIIILAGAFSFGGAWAIAIFKGIKLYFGVVTYLLPMIIAVIGYCLFYPERFPVNKLSGTGLAIFFVSLLGIFQVGLSGLQVKDGGGEIGKILADAILSIFNAPVSFIVFCITLVIGVILASNTSLKSLIGGFKKNKDMDGTRISGKEEIKINEGAVEIKDQKKE
jgi:hypothetical protein